MADYRKPSKRGSWRPSLSRPLGDAIERALAWTRGCVIAPEHYIPEIHSGELDQWENLSAFSIESLHETLWPSNYFTLTVEGMGIFLPAMVTAAVCIPGRRYLEVLVARLRKKTPQQIRQTIPHESRSILIDFLPVIRHAVNPDDLPVAAAGLIWDLRQEESGDIPRLQSALSVITK